MKIFLTILIALGCLIGLAFLSTKAYSRYIQAPPAELPSGLSNEEIASFTEDLANWWTKNGPRPGYEAVVQLPRVAAYNGLNQLEYFPQNEIVTFISLERSGRNFLYKVRFRGSEYTFIASSPFSLLYDITLLERKGLKRFFHFLTENRSEKFKEAYLSLFKELVEKPQYPPIAYRWAREVNDNFKAQIHKDLLLSTGFIDPQKFYRTLFDIKENDFTPLLASSVAQMTPGTPLYIQNPQGVELYDINYIPFKQSTAAFSWLKASGYLFVEYRYHEGLKYIVATFEKDTVFIKVKWLDEALPTSPSQIKYLDFARQNIKTAKNTDDVLKSFTYLSRQKYIDILRSVNNDGAYDQISADIIKKLSVCEDGAVGPLSQELVPGDEPKLPYLIVRKHYNNLDCLIPAWCHYNMTIIPSRASGIIKSKRPPYEYIMMKGRYHPGLPPVRELLAKVDVSLILSGYLPGGTNYTPPPPKPAPLVDPHPDPDLKTPKPSPAPDRKRIDTGPPIDTEP
jgi:hypothetical protein